MKAARWRRPSWPGGGCGEADADIKAAAAAGADGEGGLVGPGDGRDDGQAEAKAVVASGPLGGQSLERLEKPADLGGGDDRPGVSDRERRAAAARCHINAEIPAGQVVTQRVVDQVGGK